MPGTYQPGPKLDFSGLNKRAPPPKKNKSDDWLEQMLKIGGAIAPAAGTAIGAGIGSMAGGIGAVPGAAIGGAAGSALGSLATGGADAMGAGDLAADQAYRDEEAERVARAHAIQQMIGGY